MQLRPSGSAQHNSRTAKPELWPSAQQQHGKGWSLSGIAPSRQAFLALVLLTVTLVACAALPIQRHARARGRRGIVLTDEAGGAYLNCTVTRGPVGRVCLVDELQHDAALTNATRAGTGKAGALAAEFRGPAGLDSLSPVAVTFYDDPVTLAARPVLDVRLCPDATPRDGSPTVFMSRDNPSLYHLIRIQLLPMFLALAGFGLQHGNFQLVFIDSGLRDWATPVFEEAAGLPALFLLQQPNCFWVSKAIVGVRYDNFRISAHKAASAADTAASRPQLTAFSEWLLERFNVSASAAAATAALQQQLADSVAEVLQAAFADPAEASACAKLRAEDKAAPVPLLTLVVRTDRLNGQGRRLTGTEHLLAAAEACGFETLMVDMAAIPFAEQLQVVANSSVLVTMHGAATTLLLALPLGGVSVELRPYKFDASALYFHLFANWAAAAARKALVWHNTNVWHSSQGRASLDDYKNHDTRLTKEAAEGLVAAAAGALAVPPEMWDFDAPVLLNQPVLRTDFDHVPGNLG